MKILQVNTTDVAGGAEKISLSLHQSYRALGHDACLAVGFKHSNSPGVVEIPRYPEDLDYGLHYRRIHRSLDKLSRQLPLARSARHLLCQLTGGCPDIDIELGRENYHHSGTHQLLSLCPERPDVLHFHNLHGNYFDLRALPRLTHELPSLITLHDAWLLGGHCAHSFDCDRWASGCTRCDHLAIYPSISRDAARHNWTTKKRIFEKSRLFVITPCDWLMDRVQRSILSSAMTGSTVIPNGVDLEIFKPGDKAAARNHLGLPQNLTILLFAANAIRNNPWKDYATLRQAIISLSRRLTSNSFKCVALGESPSLESEDNDIFHFVPFTKDPLLVANYYQAADIYIHPAKVDSFPTTILEAMACGTPVIASHVGGIPEQVVHGECGFLVPPGDPDELANSVANLIRDENLLSMFSRNAIGRAKNLFDQKDQVAKHLNTYGIL